MAEMGQYVNKKRQEKRGLGIKEGGELEERT